jgi:hypothetical protein
LDEVFQPSDLADIFHRLVARTIQPEIVTPISFREAAIGHFPMNPLVRLLSMLAEVYDDQLLSLYELGTLTNQIKYCQAIYTSCNRKRQSFRGDLLKEAKCQNGRGSSVIDVNWRPT